MLGKQLQTAAAGAAAGEGLYVEDVFSTFTYDGTGSTRDIVNGIDLNGEGGLVWIKGRDNNRNHQLFDTERGVNNTLISNGTGEAVFDAGGRKLQAFNDDGFELGSDSLVNANEETYVSWTFRKAPGFFDVVTYTGNSTAGRTVPHNLGSVPGVIIVKNLSTPSNWPVFHRSLGATKIVELNELDDATTTSAYWNDTAPTSTNFTLGSLSNVNGSGENYVAYLFAHDEQSFGTNSDEAIIKCGSFTTNSSSEATVNLGFEPQWFMFKRTDSTGDWYILDTMRGFGAFNNDTFSEANTNDADNLSRWGEPTATGWTNVGSTMNFGSSQTYIYVAIRRPHKPPEAATDVFAIDQRVATEPNMVSNFVVDAALRKPVANTYKPQFASRLTGTKYVRTSETDSELDFGFTWDYMDGFHEDATTADSNIYSWMFKRAPGFFDVVAYEGTGSARTVGHNLGVVPELMLVKNRDASEPWGVYTSATGNGKFLQLNQTYAPANSTSIWNSTTPTATVFSVGSNTISNSSSNNTVAFLFATLAGISKVGTYTFSGSDIDVDCGFTNGARFVLIKGLDSGKDWSLFDTTRGIVSGNDPKLGLNNADPHDTGGDWIDPINSGFRVLASAGNDVSDSGVEYLFLAIA